MTTKLGDLYINEIVGALEDSLHEDVVSDEIFDKAVQSIVELLNKIEEDNE